MSMERITNLFTEVKKSAPDDLNQLLDFISHRYIEGNLSFVQYYSLFKELSLQGASKPEYIINHTLKEIV